MTKREKNKEAKEAEFIKLRMSLSPESLADAERRGMNTTELLFQYVVEIEEVRKAEERQDQIDKGILEMSKEQRVSRAKRLAKQRRVLTGGDIALLMGIE